MGTNLSHLLSWIVYTTRMMFKVLSLVLVLAGCALCKQHCNTYFNEYGIDRHMEFFEFEQFCNEIHPSFNQRRVQLLYLCGIQPGEEALSRAEFNTVCKYQKTNT